jgi:hypothetical protein
MTIRNGRYYLPGSCCYRLGRPKAAVSRSNHQEECGGLPQAIIRS